jgi:hypothetical protein
VSPHNISRCRELIDGTRRLAGVRGGKREDVLQLKTMMMCAWEEMGRWIEKQGKTQAVDGGVLEDIVMADVPDGNNGTTMNGA